MERSEWYDTQDRFNPIFVGADVIRTIYGRSYLLPRLDFDWSLVPTLTTQCAYLLPPSSELPPILTYCFIRYRTQIYNELKDFDSGVY